MAAAPPKLSFVSATKAMQNEELSYHMWYLFSQLPIKLTLNFIHLAALLIFCLCEGRWGGEESEEK